MDHRNLDRRSLELHRLAVEKIRREPTLFAKLQANINRWRPTTSKRSMPYLDAWQELIDAGMKRCLEFAIEESEQGDAMRQASPFAGVLTEEERLGFLREWRERH